MERTKDAATAAGDAPAGLRGVVAATSSIGDVDGENGVLIYQGYNIHDPATHSTFEEVVFLLWHARLPTQDELSELKAQLRQSYELPPEVIDLMRTFPRDAEPMDVLRTAVSALDFYDKRATEPSREASLRARTPLPAH